MSEYTIHLGNTQDIDSIGFQNRIKGQEVRDCFFILEPNKVKLGLITRKELEGTVHNEVVRRGTGAMDIDAGRITLDKEELVVQSGELVDMGRSTIHSGYDRPKATMFRTGKPKERSGPSNPSGRFPANLLLVHGPECQCVGTKKVKPSNGSVTAPQDNKTVANQVYQGPFNPKGVSGTAGYAGGDGKEEIANWICEPSCPVGILDRQSGILHSQDPATRKGSEGDHGTGKGTTYLSVKPTGDRYADSGGASRFFKQVQSEEELDEYLNQLIRRTTK